MAVPATHTLLRSFLGMCNFFRDSCPMLGPMIVSLSRLSGKRGKDTCNRDEWFPEHLEAFEAEGLRTRESRAVVAVAVTAMRRCNSLVLGGWLRSRLASAAHVAERAVGQRARVAEGASAVLAMRVAMASSRRLSNHVHADYQLQQHATACDDTQHPTRSSGQPWAAQARVAEPPARRRQARQLRPTARPRLAARIRSSPAIAV